MNNFIFKLLQYKNRLVVGSRTEKWFRIHFLVPNFHIGSAITRGCQISQQLNSMGIYSRVFELDYGPKKLNEIKNSIFVIVKAAFQDKEDVLSILKNNGNILIWDPLDGLVDLREQKAVRMFDGVMLSNRQCERDTAEYFSRKCVYGVVPHHWDQRCLVNNAREFRLVYFGDTTPENIAPEYIHEIKELHTKKCNNEQSFIDLLREIQAYNCHFSVRENGSDSFKFKPSVKLSFASATNSNIIVSRDYANLELLDTSYPYYTGSNVNDVKATVTRAKETYETEIWRNALEMMKGVKERTSLKRVCLDYIEMAKKFQ